jgi:glycosyltransferase involved in cell wall biosynthesis
MAEIGQASNIRIIDVKLPTEDMAALINCSDVVISLHRSEGFGLVLAEAMLLGKPVVATGWSGNMDFMDSGNAALVDYTLVPAVDEQGVYTMTDQQWAEPDVAQAAAWLRVLKDDAGLRRKIGMVAARDAAEFFKLERYRAALEATGVFDWLSAQTPSESN